MGTYTTNYQLYLPSIGEQGWGDLVNQNFTILDTKLKSGADIAADKLATARTINGTAFDGTANIVTTNWGTTRNITITDGTNMGTATPVNGSGNVLLRLPTTINASINGNITGNANQANKLKMYAPSSTMILRWVVNTEWIPQYSGYVGLINRYSNQIYINCVGYHVHTVLMASSGEKRESCFVVAGVSYVCSGNGALEVYGTASYH